MKKPWTVQCGYMAHYSNTVTVEAASLEEAIEKAIEAANGDDAWRDTGHCGPTFVDAVCEGAGGDPWGKDALPVPDRFTERGEPPVVAVTDPGRPGGGIEIVRGRVLLRFASDAGTLEAELRDPPPPPANKPLVTVSAGAGGRPAVRVEQGSARVRFVAPAP